MPLSKAHKAETREKIMAAAGRLFRLRGYEGVGIDAIMAEAGLTRGGFYAHFQSKKDLFAAVLSENHDLVRRLRERSGETKRDLAFEAVDILSAYLDPANFAKVGPNCTLSSLNVDASRASKGARDGFTHSIKALNKEILRGKSASEDGAYDERALVIAALAIGCLSLARASNDRALSRAVLRAGQSQVTDWLMPSKD